MKKDIEMVITNAAPTTTYNIRLTPLGGYPGANVLLICDGIVPGTAGYVSIDPLDKSINTFGYFLNIVPFMYGAPVKLLGLEMTSNCDLQYDGNLTYIKGRKGSVVPLWDEEKDPKGKIMIDLQEYNIDLGNDEVQITIAPSSITNLKIIYEVPDRD